jgi:hypothetical protein
MYSFPFNKKATIHILGVCGTYPHKANCYRIEVQEPGNTYRVDFAPKAEVDLGLKLQTMLTQEQLDKVKPLLKALYDQGYQDASDSAAEEAAGEDL